VRVRAVDLQWLTKARPKKASMAVTDDGVGKDGID
jgi:hypothetical protein